MGNRTAQQDHLLKIPHAFDQIKISTCPPQRQIQALIATQSSKIPNSINILGGCLLLIIIIWCGIYMACPQRALSHLFSTQHMVIFL